MAFILSDRVKETTTTTGTGTVTLGGTIDASKTFSAAIGDGNSTYYCIESPDGNFEVGVGTYTSSSNTLSRDTVISSSNSGSKISLVGVSNVFCTQPGPKAVFINTVGLVSGVNGSFQGFSFPDGTIQYTSATSGNAPTTMQRQNEGILFNYFVNNAYDETVSLHLENEQFPRFKLGLRDSPDGNSAPTYGYLFGEQGYAGGVADSTSEFFIANNNGFWIKHNSQNIANFAQDDGIIFQNVAAASPTFTVKGNAAQAADLQRWNDSSSTTLAKVTKEGHVSGVELHTPTISFADGTTQTTAGYTGTGDINVNQYIYHEGDSNTYIRFRGDQIDFVAGNVTMLTLDEASNDKVIINNGQNNVDFQVEGDGDANLIRTDAANDRVGIGTDSPSYLLDVAGSGSFEGIRFSDGTTQATSFAADVATASGALRADITTNTAAIPASGYAISGALQSQIDSLGGASISYVDAATASGVANSGFFSRELHEISGVGGLIANKSNWDTAYGWGDHSSAGYLTSQTSHADVLVDGDFSSQGLMKRGFSGGSYSIVTDNSSNWNTAYGWGDHVPYVDAATASGVANSGFFSEELYEVSGVAGLIPSTVADSGYAISGALQVQIDGISGASVAYVDAATASGVANSGFFSEELHEVSGVGGLITSTVANSGYHISGVLQPQITANTTAIPASGYHISGVLQPQITTNTTAIPASGYHISGVLQPQITTNAAAIPASGYHISGILQTQITNLNHDTLTGFVASEHIDWTADQGSTNIHTGNYDNTTYTAGSGIELQGTEFNVAISGNNILSTNTPSDNYIPSYDLDTGKFTWVENTGGGGEANQNAFSTVSVATQTDVVADSATDTLTLAAGSNVTITTNAGTDTVTIAATNTTYAKADFDIDHLFTLVGASADTDENLGTFTGSTISDSRTIKQALQDLETELETKTTNTGDITGVDLTGGTGISIDSETNTASGSYSSTITCNLEGTELASTGETGTDKFLRVDGDGTCSWQVPPDTNTTYAKADFDLDHLFTLVGASADTDEHLGTFTGSTISDNQTIKAAIQALETAVETKGAGDITGVDLTGGTGISIDSETNTGSGAYSSTITCNLEGTELASTGETGTAKFLRVDGDGTCSWQVPPDTDTTYTKASFDLDHLFALAGASADTDENLGTFTGSTISDSRTIKQALQDLETELETKGAGDMTGVDLTGGTGISIESETNTGSGAYSSTITCNLEGTELASTGETGTAKFLRVDGDGTCSWQVPPDTNTTYAKADFDIDHLFTLVGASADTDENLGTFTGSTISDSRTIKQALQDLETELETKTTNTGDITGVDLTGGTGISIDSETNTGSGAYSSTITCNLEGTELASTGETGTAKFLRVDGDGTCSWQVPPDTDTTYTKASFDVDHLFTLVGASADADEHLGTFTGSTIADNQTIKAAIQALETAVETKGATAGSSSITTVGTISTGTWQGTAIAHAYIGDDAIEGDNIADNAINSEHYTDGSINTAHIDDDQVTYAKIQNVTATNVVLGRDSAGAGIIEEISAADLRTMLNVADGATAAGTVTAINNATANELVTIGSTTTELDAQANLTFDGSTLTLAGVADITDTTDASDATGDTGALRCEGGASIAKKLYVGTDLDVDGTTNLDAVDIDGNVQLDGTLTVGVNDTGKDVKFFGATAGSYLEWDESEDRLNLVGGAYVNEAVPANDTPTASSARTLTFDLSLGNYHNQTLPPNNTTDTVNKIVFSNAKRGQRFIIRLTQHATSANTVAWTDVDDASGGAVTIRWAGNVVPVMSTSTGHTDVLGFLCTNNAGTAFDGFIIGQDLPD